MKVKILSWFGLYTKFSLMSSFVNGFANGFQWKDEKEPVASEVISVGTGFIDAYTRELKRSDPCITIKKWFKEFWWAPAMILVFGLFLSFTIWSSTRQNPHDRIAKFIVMGEVYKEETSGKSTSNTFYIKVKDSLNNIYYLNNKDYNFKTGITKGDVLYLYITISRDIFDNDSSFVIKQ